VGKRGSEGATGMAFSRSMSGRGRELSVAVRRCLEEKDLGVGRACVESISESLPIVKDVTEEFLDAEDDEDV